MTKHIIGAGLAGLIAACKFKDADIYEAGPRIESHKALLRFRDKSVSELTGIPFREVTVHKEIFLNDVTHHQCSIAHANLYSRKVAGIYAGRSIWNLNTVQRYIAPEDFYDRLVDKVERNTQIIWNTPMAKIDSACSNERQIISTAPLPVMLKVCGLDAVDVKFDRSAIQVDRYRLPAGSDVYQTIYFPDPALRVFRASITGDLLIVESMQGQLPVDAFDWSVYPPRDELAVIGAAFGIDFFECERLDSVEQKYGKIIELPREDRQAILYELTRDFNVFSIGRFATWRNILLDDVVKDIEVIDGLMAASEYGRARVLARR